MMKILSAKRMLVAALLLTPATQAIGHGEEVHGQGTPGDPAAVTRTVAIKMTDHAFEPANLHVRAGETIRFVIENAGEFVHEFNIGDSEMHAAHQVEMKSMMESGVLEADKINHAMMNMSSGGMKHDDPNAVLLEPRESGEIVWTFPESGRLQMACNVPGHYESGMVGDIEIG